MMGMGYPGGGPPQPPPQPKKVYRTYTVDKIKHPYLSALRVFPLGLLLAPYTPPNESSIIIPDIAGQSIELRLVLQKGSKVEEWFPGGIEVGDLMIVEKTIRLGIDNEASWVCDVRVCLGCISMKEVKENLALRREAKEKERAEDQRNGVLLASERASTANENGV